MVTGQKARDFPPAVNTDAAKWWLVCGPSLLAPHFQHRWLVAVGATKGLAENHTEGDAELVAAECGSGFFMFVAGFEAQYGRHAERAIGAGRYENLEDDYDHRNGDQGEDIQRDALIVAEDDIDQPTKGCGKKNATGTYKKRGEAHPSQGGRGLEAMHEKFSAERRGPLIS
jgi:hypothetical protein